jgi:hypothetical protein
VVLLTALVAISEGVVALMNSAGDVSDSSSRRRIGSRGFAVNNNGNRGRSSLTSIG